MKKYISLAMMLLTMLVSCVCANAASDFNVDNVVYTGVGTADVTATVLVTNPSAEQKEVTMLVCAYDAQTKRLEAMGYDFYDGGATETLSVTLSGIDTDAVVKTYLLNNIQANAGDIKPYKNPATAGVSSTEVQYIKINGLRISSAELAGNSVGAPIAPAGTDDVYDVAVVDGSTKVEITEGVSALDPRQIKLTASDGTVRTINVVMCEDVADLGKLKGVTVQVMGADVAHTFNKDTMEQTIPLPANTFYAHMSIDYFAGAASAVVTYEHLNPVTEQLGVIYAGSHSVSGNHMTRFTTAQTVSTPTSLFMLPIKNGAVKVTVAITRLGETKTYTFKLTSTQPKVTSLVPDTTSTTGVMFTSGAAVNGDTYDLITSGTYTTVCGGFRTVPDSLLGMSILGTASYNTGTAGALNFTFVADTPGTIQLIGERNIPNTSSYFSDWAVSNIAVQAGWAPNFTNYNWTAGNKRTFEANTEVEVPCMGNRQFYAAALIKWDGIDIDAQRANTPSTMTPSSGGGGGTSTTSLDEPIAETEAEPEAEALAE